jgi:hypothetical protein
MVLVRGGTFTMGCTSEQGSDCDTDERPDPPGYGKRFLHGQIRSYTGAMAGYYGQ